MPKMMEKYASEIDTFLEAQAKSAFNRQLEGEEQRRVSVVYRKALGDVRGVFDVIYPNRNMISVHLIMTTRISSAIRKFAESVPDDTWNPVVHGLHEQAKEIMQDWAGRCRTRLENQNGREHWPR